MAPPPPSNLAARIFLGPALRSQPDRRLVSLMRDGYEAAFEEIVRRYNKPLQRYAAAIVPVHRADDVTQDAFSKALLALRGTDKEIELRPWLYRIVRNTALNDIRDQPPATQPIPENVDGTETPEQAAERRAEIADLLERLRALPEPQRAAIVMRELEGLSHEEIAASLGITGGAARQTIFRARQALRDGFGLIVPLPVLHALLGGGLGGAASTAAGAAGASAGGGALASAGGAGAGLKGGLATLLVAGSVATGVALHERSTGANDGKARAAETRVSDRHGRDSSPAAAEGTNGDNRGPGENSGPGGGDGGGGEGPEHEGVSNSGPGGGDGGHSGPGGGDVSEPTSGSSGPGGGGGGGDGSTVDNSGPGGGGDDATVIDNSGPGSLSSGSGSGSSGSGSSGSGSGSGDRLELPDDD